MRNWLELLLEGSDGLPSGGQRHNTEAAPGREDLRPWEELPPWPDPAAPTPIPLWEGSGTAPAPAGIPPAWDSPPQPPLTVEAVDRAVRRDSRRYDGGMTID